MKLSIFLFICLSFFLMMMKLEAQTTDSPDDSVDATSASVDDDTSVDDASLDDDADDDDEADVTVTGASGYYQQGPAASGYYNYGGQQQDYGSYGWRKPKWSSSSSSAWKKQPPPKPKCPFGLAQIWFGSPNNLPFGYQICDGTNGTPDLQDRLVIGAGHKFHFSTTGGAYKIELQEEQLPAHKHEAGNLMANDAGEHDHNLKTKIDGGEHEHKKFDLKAQPAGGHAHVIDLETDKAGEHNHVFDVYQPVSYDTPEDKLEFAVPLDAIEKRDSYPQEVSKEKDHIHKVKGKTEEVYDHEHKVDGSIGPDGEHCHEIDAKTSKDGSHKHPVVGYTDKTGEGKPIDIMNPYHALYFICCGKKETPPPAWKNSQYYK